VRAVPVAQELYRIEENKVVCFGEEIAETKATMPKNCPEFQSR
jgi:hypothetical protein